MTNAQLTAIQIVDVTGRSLNREAPGAPLVRASVSKMLETNVLCSMATVTRDGKPHINTAYFSYSDALDLYFLSHPGSLHCRNLASNPSMAVTVFCSAQQWTEPDIGIQLFGAGEQATGSLMEEAELSYARRFPVYASWTATLGRDDVALEYRFYVFRITTLKILDEGAFGDAVFVLGSIERRPEP